MTDKEKLQRLEKAIDKLQTKVRLVEYMLRAQNTKAPQTGKIRNQSIAHYEKKYSH